MKVFVVPDHQPQKKHDNQDLDKLPSEHCDSTWAVRRQKFRQHQKQREERRRDRVSEPRHQCRVGCILPYEKSRNNSYKKYDDILRKGNAHHIRNGVHTCGCSLGFQSDRILSFVLNTYNSPNGEHSYLVMGMLNRIYLLSTKPPKPFDLMALLLDPVYDALELVEIGKFNHDPALALRVGGELHDGTERFGERSYDRLQASNEKSRRCTLAKFIAGLGIPMVGRHAGRDLDRYFHGSWAEFEAAILNGFDFTQLPDFGETMHNNIYTWYADTQEAKLWRPLLRKIQFETKENLTMETTMNNPFAGKTVVATGKLEHYTRDGIQEKLTSLGAHPAGAASKKTEYLIVGEKAGSKLTKAQQLGVKTLTEQEFEDMLA